MSRYFIHGSSTTPAVPYDSTHNAASSFTMLMANVDLVDGDVICVGGVVDESSASNDFDFVRNITIMEIVGIDTPTVLLPPSRGFVIHGDSSNVTNIHFQRDTSTIGSFISVHGNSVTISGCEFTTTNAGSGGIYAEFVGVTECLISNNIFTTEISTASDMYGVALTGATGCLIEDNIFNDLGLHSSSIIIHNGSKYNTVRRNVIGNMRDINTTGVYVNESVYTTIENNVVYSSGVGSSCITLINNGVSISNEIIANNTLIIVDDDAGCSGITIPYAGSSQTEVFSIVSNSFIFYESMITSYSIELELNDSIALNVNIINGEIDYNNFYGFKFTNIYYNNGDPALIKFGHRNILEPPHMFISKDFSIDRTDIKSYYSTDDSALVGSGKDQHNIGVGYRGTSKEIVSIMDTLTYELGDIKADMDRTIVSFQADVFTESALEMNTIYKYGTDTYPNYDCQFGWNFTSIDGFPLADGGILYGDGFIELLKNKGTIAPFDGITCPANPGYGWSIYKEYESGVFGYERLGYANGCDFTCIIQDTVSDVQGYEDTVNQSALEIQDHVHPPCEDLYTGPEFLRTLAIITFVESGVPDYAARVVDLDNSKIIKPESVKATIAAYTGNGVPHTIEILPNAVRINRYAFSGYSYGGFSGSSFARGAGISVIDFSKSTILDSISWRAFAFLVDIRLESDLIYPNIHSASGFQQFGTHYIVDFSNCDKLVYIRYESFRYWENAGQAYVDNNTADQHPLIIPENVTDIDAAFPYWKKMMGGILFKTKQPPRMSAHCCSQLERAFGGWSAATAAGGIKVTVPDPTGAGCASLSEWKVALIDRADKIHSINGTLWDAIP